MNGTRFLSAALSAALAAALSLLPALTVGPALAAERPAPSPAASVLPGASVDPIPGLPAGLVVEPVDLRTGAGTPHRLVDVDGTLFFWTDDDEGPTRLWRSDGTASGTAPVGICRSVLVCGTQRNLAFIENVAGSLFFFTAEGAWRSDGTVPGTRMIVRRTEWWHRVTGPFGHRSRCAVAASTTHVFLVTSEDCDDPYPQLLVAIDVATGTVRRLPVLGDEMVTALIPAGDRVLVLATTGEGHRAWLSDGTRGGTRRLAGSLPSSIWGAAATRGTLVLLLGYDEERELWAIDTKGKGGRTSRIPWRIAREGVPFEVAPLGDGLLVVSKAPSTCAIELWSLGSGKDASVRLATLREAGEASDEDECVEPSITATATQAGDEAILVVNDPVRGDQVWGTDGTAEGTRQVYATEPDPDADEEDTPQEWVLSPVALGDILLFGVSRSTGPGSIWATDGTVEGTARVAELAGGPGELVVSDGVAFFTALDPSGAWGLWSVGPTRPETTPPPAVIEPSPDPRLSTLLPDGLSLDRMQVVTTTGPEWVARHDPAHPATPVALAELDRFLDGVGRTIDDLGIAGGVYGRRGNVVATITAIHVRDAREPDLADAIMPFVFAGMVTPRQKEVDVDGRRVISVTDRDLGGNYRQYVYASGDVAWVIDADVRYLTEIIRALPPQE